MKTRVAAAPNAAPTVRVRTFDVTLVICASKSAEWRNRPLVGVFRNALVPERFQRPSAYGSAARLATDKCASGMPNRPLFTKSASFFESLATRGTRLAGASRRPLGLRAVPWNEVWSDARLDEPMAAIEHTFERIDHSLRDLGAEVRAMRSDLTAEVRPVNH